MKCSWGRWSSGLLLAVGALAPSTAVAQGPDRAGDGVIAYRSDTTFAATLARAQAAIEDRPVTLMLTVDHAAAAERVGRALAPNTVLVFGAPQIGSQIMACAPGAGIDLPQKLQIRAADDGVVVAYNDPAYLRSRHAVEGCDSVLEQVSRAVDGIAREAAGVGSQEP